jgi:hypothetical protein
MSVKFVLSTYAYSQVLTEARNGFFAEEHAVDVFYGVRAVGGARGGSGGPAQRERQKHGSVFVSVIGSGSFPRGPSEVAGKTGLCPAKSGKPATYVVRHQVFSRVTRGLKRDLLKWP